MEEILSYMKEHLPALAKVVPGTTLSYVYDRKYSQHVIVVQPRHNYDHPDFAEAQIAFEVAFITKFDHDGIMVTDTFVEGLPLEFDFKC